MTSVQRYGKKISSNNPSDFSSRASENQKGNLHSRNCAVYKRLSTFEQVRDSRYSLIRQHRLTDFAIKDGYEHTLTQEQITEIKAKPNYKGWYQDGNIFVIECDLGISSQNSQKDRPGLDLLVHLIESDQIETIYVLDVTRLYRDTEMVNASTFAKLCKDHKVKLIICG